MKAEELRALQKPFKDQYRSAPDAAQITLRAQGRIGEGLTCTLGVDKMAPVGFKAIRLRFELDTDASPEQRAKLLELTERYCVVYQTLRQPPPVQVSA